MKEISIELVSKNSVGLMPGEVLLQKLSRLNRSRQHLSPKLSECLYLQNNGGVLCVNQSFRLAITIQHEFRRTKEKHERSARYLGGTTRCYMNDLYPAKLKTSRVYPAISATRKSEQWDTCINKERVDPTKSAIRKSEHLDMLVTSIAKARVNTTESATQKSDQQFDVLGGNTDKHNNTDVIVSSEIVLDDPTVSSATPVSTVAVTSLLE
ncbi:hypothetical protein CQW23_22054 [Capsicum baccatum]|uniref:Uncharacterized protein n=1 Tax=Capsicum baccatum TaxID=33114 RepID=A0A2G2VZU3_CAPBA|nr:hypothetical protein CQW23_22054 [Capsicum baccatum]